MTAATFTANKTGAEERRTNDTSTRRSARFVTYFVLGAATAALRLRTQALTGVLAQADGRESVLVVGPGAVAWRPARQIARLRIGQEGAPGRDENVEIREMARRRGRSDEVDDRNALGRVVDDDGVIYLATRDGGAAWGSDIEVTRRDDLRRIAEIRPLWVTKGQDSLMLVGDADGHHARRCGTCFSLVYWTGHEGKIRVPYGSLIDEPALKPMAHMFVGSKAPWYEILDDLPQYDEYPWS